MDDDPLFGLFLFGVGIFLLAVGLLLLATVYIVVLTIVSYIQYRQYLHEAEQEFDEIGQEVGADLSTEEILMSVGVEVPRDPEFDTVDDWMARAPLSDTVNDWMAGPPLGVVLFVAGLAALAMWVLVMSARGQGPRFELRRRAAGIREGMKLSSYGVPPGNSLR